MSSEKAVLTCPQQWPCRYQDPEQCAHDRMFGSECPKLCSCVCHQNRSEKALRNAVPCKHYGADIRKEELLSCPFCGGKPKIQNNGDYEIVMCLNGDCYAQISIRDRQGKSAREVWNTRVLDH